ncbi:MAG: hypothetical protein PHZ19_08680 [Candidatus Thermoplasmatota archaeon]|nr:hypothetical protein [Candidatus Thermoplasmatota archaeon]
MCLPSRNTTIFAVGVLMLIAMLIAVALILGKSELAAYIAISLLGLLAYMVKCCFGKPNDEQG